MARVQFGGGVTGMLGAIGGTVFSKNRFGYYARPRTPPVNPNSDRQVAARTRMGFLSEQYHEAPMDDAKRLAWDTYASGISAVGAFGQSITLTGLNAFIAGNSLKILNGSDIVEDGPVVIGLPAQDPAFSVELSEANGATVNFDEVFDWCDEDDAYLSIELGKPQSPSRNFFGGPWRWALNVAGDGVAAPTTPEGPTASTTWTLLEGQAVWARARILRADGRVSGFFGHHKVIVGA